MSGVVFNKSIQGEAVVLSGQGTLPAVRSLTGTILTDGTGVRGNGTLFTRELSAGDFLYNGSVLREVDRIVSDTLLFLKRAFPANMAAGSALRVPGRQRYRGVAVRNTGPAAGVFNEFPVPAGETKTLRADSGIAPLSYDAAGTSFIAELLS